MEYQGKKVAVVGLGISNRALISFLSKQGAEILACDQKELDQIPDLEELEQWPVGLQLGRDYLKELETFDEVFLTPGMCKDLRRSNADRGGSTHLHGRACSWKDAPG